MYAIGIDIGGMSAKIGLLMDGMLVKEERIPTGSDLDYAPFVTQLCDRVTALRAKFPVEKVGISSCGLINRAMGRIVYSNNIRWENKNLVGDVHKRVGLPVKIANDAKCAALAEAVMGAGKDYSRVCMITLGTGVGGCFIRDKHLEEGNAYADADGILGHITVEKNGRPCTCGRRGCLEAYASASAIMKTYQEKTGRALSAQEVFQRARAGEPSASETVRLFRDYLADGLVSLVNVLRPEVIVLGGGVAGSGEDFIPHLQEAVNTLSYGGSILPVKIMVAELGNQAGMIGAALL